MSHGQDASGHVDVVGARGEKLAASPRRRARTVGSVSSSSRAERRLRVGWTTQCPSRRRRTTRRSTRSRLVRVGGWRSECCSAVGPCRGRLRQACAAPGRGRPATSSCRVRRGRAPSPFRRPPRTTPSLASRPMRAPATAGTGAPNTGAGHTREALLRAYRRSVPHRGRRSREGAPLAVTEPVRVLPRFLRPLSKMPQPTRDPAQRPGSLRCGCRVPISRSARAPRRVPVRLRLGNRNPRRSSARVLRVAGLVGRWTSGAVFTRPRAGIHGPEAVGCALRVE